MGAAFAPTGTSAGGPRLAPELQHELASVCADIPPDFGGGSSVFKALVLADLIVANRLEEVVEIGVWRGRSLPPLAVLLKRLGRGRIVGIDPYVAQAARQTDDRLIAAELDRWARETNWEAVVGDVRAAIGRWGVEGSCQLVRATSRDAAVQSADGSVDLLHIDGNHDRAAVGLDLELYLPKLRPGGLVVLDDTSWPSVRVHHDDLRARHELVFEIFNPPDLVTLADGLPNDFAVFRA